MTRIIIAELVRELTGIGADIDDNINTQVVQQRVQLGALARPGVSFAFGIYD
ncbi:hypothetical protein [Salinisphaera sp. C84B14]|uniref:hypothetical protein n=1 Tax=Salinisphaera sp. C84B14 TaxID=1304155 RepID=UPI00333F0493